MESDDASGSDCRSRPPDHGDRIALMKEHEAAQRGIERPGDRDVVVGRYEGFDIAVACRICPGASGLDRTRLAINSDDMTIRANGLRKEHRYVARTTADIQDPHARLDAAFADQSACDMGHGCGLKLEALDLEIGMAENVVGRAAHGASPNKDELFRLST
jgi:hypothetical protein